MRLIIKIVALIVTAAPGAIAAVQSAAAPAGQTHPGEGSITGSVLEETTLAPVPDAHVFLHIADGDRYVESNTDALGHYELRGLPPGQYYVWAYPGQGGPPLGTEIVMVTGGEPTRRDFKVQLSGEIAGRVVDDDQHPLPGMMVSLISREYSGGALRYHFASAAVTDERGEYVLKAVPPERACLVLAQKRVRKLEPISDAPENPKLRDKTSFPTYYPNSPQIDAAQPIMLYPHEERKGVDIRMPFSPSYCIAGVLEAGGSPAAVSFEIAEQEPTFSSFEGMSFKQDHGTTGPDGKIRICDLHPGPYRLTVVDVAASDGKAPVFFASTSLSITNADLNDVSVAAQPRMTLAGEVVWDNAPPEPAPPAQVSVSLQPLGWPPNRFEREMKRLAVHSSIPGELSFPDLLLDEYLVRARAASPDLYVKDITYGGASALYEPLRLGSVVGNAPLRVTVARDGGFVSAKVTDRDDKPLGATTVVVIPANYSTPALLAAALVSGRTNVEGVYTSGCLAPGKYYVLASARGVDSTPECISKLLSAKPRAHELEVGPNATVRVTLTPLSLE